MTGRRGSVRTPAAGTKTENAVVVEGDNGESRPGLLGFTREKDGPDLVGSLRLRCRRASTGDGPSPAAGGLPLSARSAASRTVDTERRACAGRVCGGHHGHVRVHRTDPACEHLARYADLRWAWLVDGNDWSDMRPAAAAAAAGLQRAERASRCRRSTRWCLDTEPADFGHVVPGWHHVQLLMPPAQPYSYCSERRADLLGTRSVDGDYNSKVPDPRFHG